MSRMASLTEGTAVLRSPSKSWMVKKIVRFSFLFQELVQGINQLKYLSVPLSQCNGQKLTK